jgi:hypothetical protein
MTTWHQFSDSAAELAEFGEQRINGRICYLATVRLDGSPRVHPVSPFIADGHLLLHMEPASPKKRDLLRDPRFALHCSVADNGGGSGEFLVRGRGQLISEPALRNLAFTRAVVLGLEPKERYILFALSIEEAMSTIYDDDGPLRQKWKEASEGSQYVLRSCPQQQPIHS